MNLIRAAKVSISKSVKPIQQGRLVALIIKDRHGKFPPGTFVELDTETGEPVKIGELRHDALKD